MIRLYTGFQFFFTLLLWLPIFYEYQRRLGLSDGEIFRIQSIYYLAFCFLEIPTGYIADRWGHRWCMRGGAGILVVSNLLPVLAPFYLGFLWHFLLLALSRSLISGASSAYLYDYLRGQGMAGEYKQIEGSARAYGLVGKVVCWAGVGVLMAWHFSLPYWITAGAALVSLGIAIALPSLSTVSSAVGAKVRIREVWPVFLKSPMMIIVIAQGVGAFVLARICQVNLFQPILEQRSFGLPVFGVMMSVTTLFEAAGAARPQWIRRWMGDLSAVFVLSAVMAVSLLMIAVSGKAGTAIGLCAFCFATGLSFPIQRQLLNDAIPDSRYRATLLSLESLVDRAVCSGVVVILGSYVSQGRLNEFLQRSAVLTLLILGALWLFTVVAGRRKSKFVTPSVRM